MCAQKLNSKEVKRQKLRLGEKCVIAHSSEQREREGVIVSPIQFGQDWSGLEGRRKSFKGKGINIYSFFIKIPRNFYVNFLLY